MHLHSENIEITEGTDVNVTLTRKIVLDTEFVDIVSNAQ